MKNLVKNAMGLFDLQYTYPFMYYSVFTIKLIFYLDHKKSADWVNSEGTQLNIKKIRSIYSSL